MRQLTLDALRATLSQEVDEVFLVLLKISHPDLEEPEKFVNDRQNLTRTDGTYRAAGFDIVLAADEEDNISMAELIVPALEFKFVELVRSTTTPFTVSLEVVTASNADVPEVGPMVYEAVTASYANGFISISLGFHRNIFNDAFPKDIFSPNNAVSV